MKEYRNLLDYNYDPCLENYHNSYDEEYESQIRTKQEKIEVKCDDYVHDDDCYITDIKERDNNDKDRGFLFEGINIQNKVILIRYINRHLILKPLLLQVN